MINNSGAPPRPAEGFEPAHAQGVFDVIKQRRDVRSGFLTTPIDPQVLHKVLAAAHCAPSVGMSQPWDFMLVTETAIKQRVADIVAQQRKTFETSLPSQRAAMFAPLQIEAIHQTPVNIAVTHDKTRGGRFVLGRHADPRTSAFSVATAVQNLWLAARAEGLGVGWVSFATPEQLAQALELPDHIEVVAYLCVGHVSHFTSEPELKASGWAQGRPLDWAIHHNHWGSRALPGGTPLNLLEQTLARIVPADPYVREQAHERQCDLTKPAGALGDLEDIAIRVCAATGELEPRITPAAVAVFAGDHGVCAQEVSGWPQDITAGMIAATVGGAAAVSVFAKQVGAEVCVVDMGTVSPIPGIDPETGERAGDQPGLLRRRIASQTADITQESAMSPDQALAAVQTGIGVAQDLVAAGYRLLAGGELGIGNTTSAAALVAAATGAHPQRVTGRGTGRTSEEWAHKVDVVEKALHRHKSVLHRVTQHPEPDALRDPLAALAALGGFEHAALVGFYLGAASCRVPVVLDGVNACAAALIAQSLCPAVGDYFLAGHLSTEPAATIALNHLNLTPVLSMQMRLGEGTGAVLALPIIQAACATMSQMARFSAMGLPPASPVREDAQNLHRSGPGTVTLVGGGPGDPGLLTLAGAQALREAEVIVADRLVPQSVLADLAGQAKVIEVGKTPYGPSVSQEEINTILIEQVNAGRRVVRLKGGDNFLFGRGMEEVEALAQAGFPTTVIPGVSSALAGPSAAGIPVTHRGLVQGLSIVSGHVPPHDPASTVDWAAIAQSGTTLVVLMGLKNWPLIAAALQAAGLPENTKAACIERATTPQQQVVHATVATLQEELVAAEFMPPAIIVVGDVAGFAETQMVDLRQAGVAGQPRAVKVGS